MSVTALISRFNSPPMQALPAATPALPGLHQFIPTATTEANPSFTIQGRDFKKVVAECIERCDLQALKSFSPEDLKNLGYFPVDVVANKMMDKTAKHKDFFPFLDYLVGIGCLVSESSAEAAVTYDRVVVLEKYLEHKAPDHLIPYSMMQAAASHSKDQRTIMLIHQAGVSAPPDNDPENSVTVKAAKPNTFGNMNYLCSLGYPLYPACYGVGYSLNEGQEAVIRLLWNHNILPDDEGLTVICCVDNCIDILEQCLEMGMMPNSQALYWAMENNCHAVVERLLKIPELPTDFYTVEKALGYFQPGSHSIIFDRLLPRCRLPLDMYVWYSLILKFKDTLLPQFIEKLGYTEELLEAAVALANENKYQSDSVQLVRQYFDRNIPVSKRCLIRVIDAAPRKMVVAFLDRYKGDFNNNFSICFSNPYVDALDLWNLLKSKGMKATTEVFRSAMYRGKYVLAEALIAENTIDFSEFQLHDMCQDEKVLKQSLDIFSKIPVKISLDCAITINLNNDAYYNFFAHKLRAMHPDLANDQDLDVFCENCLFLIKKWERNEKLDFIRQQNIDLLDLLLAIYFEDNSIPLEKRVIAHLFGSSLIWGELCPNFDLPSSLVGYSPGYFNQEIYTGIIHHLKTNCKEGATTQKELCAYKLSIVCRSTEAAIKYLDDFAEKNRRSMQPVHDACLFDIPQSGIWNQKLWQEILDKNNFHMRWLRLLAFAPDVERAFSVELPPTYKLQPGLSEKELKEKYFHALYKIVKNHPDHASQLDKVKGKNRQAIGKILYKIAPSIIPDDVDALVDQLAPKTKKTIEEAREQILEKENHFDELLSVIVKRRCLVNYTYNQLVALVVRRVYPKVKEEHLPFALACIKGGITRKTFDKILDLCTKEAKKWDLIPEVAVDGTTIGLPEYQMQTLQKNDPFGGILGKLTSCCQSIDGPGHNPAFHGMQSLYGRFIVIKKPESKDPWVAQSWVGITERGEVVFDSIEFNKGHNTAHIMALYQAAADMMLRQNPKINGVYFGGGGNTPKNHRFPLDKDSDNYSPIIGYDQKGYDSVSQRFVLVPPRKFDHDDLALDIPPEALVVVEGKDAFISPGMKKKSLALNLFDRARFFASHPKAHELLRLHPMNPLLEEGFYQSPDKRAHFGEFFIPFDAAKLIIKEKIENHLIYRPTHLVLVDNDTVELRNQLKVISLAEGQNIMVGYIDGVHAIFAYIEMVEGKLRSVVVDSEHPDDDGEGIYSFIRGAFPGITLGHTKDSMQVDLYSCTTFMIKAMLEFAKDGRALTDEILSGQTPAQLFKLSQRSIPPEQLDRIASKNKNLTLAQYLQQQNVVFDGKSYNAAALRKKYKYLHQFMTPTDRPLPPLREVQSESARSTTGAPTRPAPGRLLSARPCR